MRLVRGVQLTVFQSERHPGNWYRGTVDGHYGGAHGTKQGRTWLITGMSWRFEGEEWVYWSPRGFAAFI